MSVSFVAFLIVHLLKASTTEPYSYVLQPRVDVYCTPLNVLQPRVDVYCTPLNVLQPRVDVYCTPLNMQNQAMSRLLWVTSPLAILFKCTHFQTAIASNYNELSYFIINLVKK